MNIDRLSIALKNDDPTSLVGSFFHGMKGKFHGNQGCVVAEIVPHTVYLCEFFSWSHGDSLCQSLVNITDMYEGEWFFYDKAEWMNNMYEASVSITWEKEREEKRKRKEDGK